MERKYNRGKELMRRAHEIIPGGCHTYAKGDDQFPELAPAFIAAMALAVAAAAIARG